MELVEEGESTQIDSVQEQSNQVQNPERDAAKDSDGECDQPAETIKYFNIKSVEAPKCVFFV